jgi:hypothetical protein
MELFNLAYKINFVLKTKINPQLGLDLQNKRMRKYFKCEV